MFLTQPQVAIMTAKITAKNIIITFQKTNNFFSTFFAQLRAELDGSASTPIFVAHALHSSSVPETQTMATCPSCAGPGQSLMVQTVSAITGALIALAAKATAAAQLA